MASFKDRINILFDEGKNIDYRMSQQDFATKFGASRGQLQGWLIGAGEPDTEMLKIISQKSGVSVDWLVGITDIRHGVIDSTDQFSEKFKKEHGIISINYEMDKDIHPEKLTPDQIKIIKIAVAEAIKELKKQG